MAKKKISDKKKVTSQLLKSLKSTSKLQKKNLPKSPYVFVKDFDYKGDVNQQYKDLENEQDYVAENIELRVVQVTDRRSREYFRTTVDKNGNKKTKLVERKKKNGLEVYDKNTGKKLSITKFKKYFNLKNSEIEYIVDKVSIKLNPKGVNGVFNDFRKQSYINIQVDFRDIEDLRKYGTIYYNNKKVSFRYLLEALIEYLEQVERDYYIFKLDVQLKKGSIAIIQLSHEIIDFSMDDSADNSFVDSDGNFILFSSK